MLSHYCLWPTYLSTLLPVHVGLPTYPYLPMSTFLPTHVYLPTYPCLPSYLSLPTHVYLPTFPFLPFPSYPCLPSFLPMFTYLHIPTFQPNVNLPTYTYPFTSLYNCHRPRRRYRSRLGRQTFANKMSSL